MFARSMRIHALAIVTVGAILALSSGVLAEGKIRSPQKVVEKTSAGAVIASGGEVDRVVASIDGEPVTIGDLANAVDLREIQGAASGEPMSLKERVMNYVAQDLVEREAKSSGVDVNVTEIDAYVDEIKKQNNVDEKAFVEMLGSRKLTLDTYRKYVRTEILRSRIVGARVRAKITISDGDIERYLAERPELAPAKGSVHLEQVFVPKETELTLNSSTAPTLSISDIAQGIKEGKDLAEVYPEGYTDLGFVKIDDLKSEIQEAAKKLEPGDVSDVISGDRGSYIIKVVSRNDEEKVELPAALKDSIRNELFQDRLKEEVTKYLNEELPKKYNVEIKV